MRRGDMRSLMIRYLSVVPLLISASAGAAPVIGTARAIDGDSLMVSDQEVRLFGIDAPELMQTCTRNGEPWNCGQVAKDQLAKLIAGKQVVCVPVTVDRYRRTVARCTAGAVELNRVMVAVGYAVAFRRYSLDYGSAEDSARASKRGLWSGTFELPAEVRQAEAGHRPESAPSARGHGTSDPLRGAAVWSRSPPADAGSRAITRAGASLSITFRGGRTTTRRSPKRYSAAKTKLVPRVTGDRGPTVSVERV